MKRQLSGDEHKVQRGAIWNMILESDPDALNMKLLKHEQTYGGKADGGYFISTYGWDGLYPPTTWSRALNKGSPSTTMRAERYVLHVMKVERERKASQPSLWSSLRLSSRFVYAESHPHTRIVQVGALAHVGCGERAVWA